MKKILALFLVFALLITVAACNRADDAAGDTTTTSTTTSTGGTTTTTASSFVKPAGCVSVLEVSINPLFRLYLDAEDVVLAVECLNADAIAMEKELNVVNTKCDVAVTSLVSAANNKGFVKADTVVRLEMVESGKSNTSALMSKAESAVAGLASDLEMTFSVTVAQPTGEGATDSDANQTTLSPEHTAATEKATSTTKKSTTTTTTTKAVDYQIKERTYFSYSRPEQTTDYETGEAYWYELGLSISFYPEGGEFMDGSWYEPVFSVFVEKFVELIPKTDYPACQQGMVNYYLENYQHMLNNFDLTWADLFEDPELRAENSFITHNGVEYMRCMPGFGGFSTPFFRYTIDNKTGTVTFSPVYECELEKNCSLLSLTMQPGGETLVATFMLDGKQETQTLTAKHY